MDLSGHGNGLVRKVDGLFPGHCAFPTGRTCSFTGLSQTDRAVLSEALRVDSVRPDAWWIEAPVGDVPEWARGADAPPWYKDFAWQYQLRADLVSVTGDQVQVTEIKGEVRPGAVGQVLVYTFVLQRQLGRDVAVWPAILGRYAGAEVREFCEALGVNLFTLDPLQ